MPEHSIQAPVFTVLLVCTGNICRSALGERLGRAYLEQVMGQGASAVRVVSAGTRAVVDSAMHPDSARVLRGLGAEPGDFRARQLDEVIAAEADLTLTMTRAHRRAVLGMAPRAIDRMFTVREAADLVSLLEGSEPVGEGLTERARDLVRVMGEARSRRDVRDDEDDVPDPVNRPVEVHEEVALLIAETLLPVLGRIAALDAAPESNAAEAAGQAGRPGGMPAHDPDHSPSRSAG